MQIEKNDQMNQLLNEKDLSSVKLCFESFLITEEEQKSKNINFINLYQFVQQMHYEMDQREKQLKTKKSFFSSIIQRFKRGNESKQQKCQQQSQRLDDSPTKKKRKGSNSQREFFVFQVVNIHTDTSFFVRVKAVYLDNPLIMIIFENQEIVKNNNKLKKQMEISNILNTSFFFEVSKKCELIKWAMKEKQTNYIEFLFSLLQNNVYSIRKRQEKKQKEHYSSPLLKKRQLDQSTASLVSSPCLKFQFSKGNEIQMGKLNLSKLFTSITQNNISPQCEHKISSQNIKQSLGISIIKQGATEGNSFMNDKKSFSIDVDKHLSEDSGEYETNSIYEKCTFNDQFSEMTTHDLKQRNKLEGKYEFQHLYKNNFQRTQSMEIDDANSKQDDSRVKIFRQELYEQENKQLQSNNNSKVNTAANLVQIPSAELYSSLKVPQTNQSNSKSEFYKQITTGGNVMGSPFNQSYSKSIEQFKKQKSVHLFSPLAEQNKRNSLKLVQEILQYQINQLTSQNDRNQRISGSINKNYQFSTSVFDRELLSPTKEREQCASFDFSEIIQDLSVYGKMLNMKLDGSLIKLKIYNDKEAILYILKSFFSSVIALNYLNNRCKKKQIQSNEKVNIDKQKKDYVEEQSEFKSIEQLRNYASSLRDYSITKITKKSSVASNQGGNNTPKSKEVTFQQQMQSHFNLKKNIRNTPNFSPTTSPYKMKLNQVNAYLKEAEDSKNSLPNTNQIQILNNNFIKFEKAANNLKIPPGNLGSQSPSSYGEKSSNQTDFHNKYNETIDEQSENQLNNSNACSTLIQDDIKVEILLDQKQIAKSLMIRISNISKDDLIRCLNFNTNTKISEMEYENIKEIIQRIGPYPLSYENGKVLFAFLVDINQIYACESASPLSYQFKQQKSDVNDNLGMIPEEQEIAKTSVIKLNSAN